jgi:hypothetical protein
VRALLPGLTLLGLLVLGSPATASWSTRTTGVASISSTTLHNATSFSAACSGTQIRLAWTRSTDPFVTSYVIQRSVSGLGVEATITVAATDTTYTDSPSVLLGPTYGYTITARSGAWTTTTSAPAVRGFTGTLGACV